MQKRASGKRAGSGPISRHGTTILIRSHLREADSSPAWLCLIQLSSVRHQVAMLISVREWLVLRRFIQSLGYFFSPSVKFVISVIDWLPSCESRETRILLPSGETSL
jgi:hypothetical protein